MPHDEAVADRVRNALLRANLAPDEQVEEMRMFGGVAFMVRGHMAIGVNKSDLLVRVRDEDGDAALAAPHARPMDFTGRPMKNFVFVAPAGFHTDKALDAWLARALAFARSAPDKKRSAKKKPAAKKPAAKKPAARKKPSAR
ncbi:MAG: TfoX/Sxy family protein [Polyangiaceae bacterium]